MKKGKNSAEGVVEIKSRAARKSKSEPAAHSFALSRQIIDFGLFFRQFAKLANKVTDTTRPLLCLTVLILFAACAVKPVVWQKTNTQPEEQRAALAACRVYAAVDADRDFKRQQNSAASPGYGGQSTYNKNMTAYQGRKSRDVLLSRCMKLKGYRPVSTSN